MTISMYSIEKFTRVAMSTYKIYIGKHLPRLRSGVAELRLLRCSPYRAVKELRLAKMKSRCVHNYYLKI